MLGEAHRDEVGGQNHEQHSGDNDDGDKPGGAEVKGAVADAGCFQKKKRQAEKKEMCIQGVELSDDRAIGATNEKDSSDGKNHERSDHQEVIHRNGVMGDVEVRPVVGGQVDRIGGSIKACEWANGGGSGCEHAWVWRCEK